MKEKKKKDRRIRLSTLELIIAAMTAGLFILSFSFSYAWGKYDQQIEARTSTKVFADINLETLDGKRFTKDEAGETGLIAYNVWETTCTACLSEMPDLEKLSQEYDPSEFRLVGVCADLQDKEGNLKPDQLKKANELMDKAGVTFPNLIPNQELQDFIKVTVSGFPTTFFVNSHGEIVSTTSGSKSLEEWEAYVNAQLKEQENQ